MHALRRMSMFEIYKESFKVLNNTNILSIILLFTAILTLLSSLLYTFKYGSSIILTIAALFTPFLLIYVAKQDFLVKLSKKDWIYAYATGLIIAIIIGLIFTSGEILSEFNYISGFIVIVFAVIIDLMFFAYFPQNSMHKKFFLNNIKFNYYVFKKKPLRTFSLAILISLSFLAIIVVVQLILILLFVNYPVLSIWIVSLAMWFLLFYASSSLIHAYSLIFVEKY